MHVCGSVCAHAYTQVTVHMGQPLPACVAVLVGIWGQGQVLREGEASKLNQKSGPEMPTPDPQGWL